MPKDKPQSFELPKLPIGQNKSGEFAHFVIDDRPLRPEQPYHLDATGLSDILVTYRYYSSGTGDWLTFKKGSIKHGLQFHIEVSCGDFSGPDRTFGINTDDPYEDLNEQVKLYALVNNKRYAVSRFGVPIPVKFSPTYWLQLMGEFTLQPSVLDPQRIIPAAWAMGLMIE